MMDRQLATHSRFEAFIKTVLAVTELLGKAFIARFDAGAGLNSELAVSPI